MAKKPILTDDELDGGLPTPGRAPASSGVTRPLDAASAPASPAPAGSGAATRMVGETPTSSATRIVEDATPEGPPQQGRDASGHVRPKTRVRGAREAEKIEVAPPEAAPVVGWLAVINGPGRGATFAISTGMNAIGRGAEHAVSVDFGDETISETAHAYVTYDDETRQFHVSHAGQTNIVRLNDAPVLTAETLGHGDAIRIGETTFRFVALCGPDFDWTDL